MTNKTAFEKAMHTNWGRRDAEYDIERHNRNRDYIRQGELFCLPAFNREYSEGYRQARRDRS